MKTEQTTRQLANEALGYLQDACGDAASGMLVCPGWDDKWDKKIKQARRKGVQDILGWLADELYNDPDTIEDLLGDRVHDLAGGDRTTYRAVLTELSTRAHPALKTAVTNLLRDQ